MIRFLQISDIHFSDETGSSDEYAQMKRKFLEDIRECHRVLGKIDHVLICGDIAFCGKDSQYRDVKKFVGDICNNAGCTNENVFVVPGNHDKKRDVYIRARSMMRDSLLRDKNTKLLIDSKVDEPMAVGILYAPFKQYYKFASEYFCISDIARKSASFPESGQETGGVPKFQSGDLMYWREELGTINGYKIAIYGSNTSLLSDKDDGDSRKLEENQHLQVLPLQAYNATVGSDEIHILMLHHPMSEIIDGTKIEREIDELFKVQLYGHVHLQSSSDKGAIKIYSGALQPPEGEGDINYFPVYNVIELDIVDKSGEPYLFVQIFSRRWNGSKFVEYSDETKSGKNSLILPLPQNDSWKITKEMLEKEGIKERIIEEPITQHAIKHAFLRSGKEGRIIKDMYGAKFDTIVSNRIKYLEFLKAVEIDNRFNELRANIEKYGQRSETGNR